MARTYEGVPARWAIHNERGAGKGSGQGKRVSFAGRTFYSYQTPVAVYHANARGEKCVLAANYKWSVSTAQHLSSALWSASVPKFRVDRIGNHGGWNHEPLTDGEEMHVHNAAHLQKGVDDLFNEYAPRWRACLPTTYSTRYIEHGCQAIEQYCAFWDIPLPEGFVPAQTLIERLVEGWQRAKDKFDDPKAVAKRERARARRLAKQVLEY